MSAQLPQRHRRFPRVASGRRSGLIVVLVLAGLARAATGAGTGICVGAAFGSPPAEPARILPAIAVLVLATFGLRLLQAGFSEQLGQSFISQVRLRLLDAVTQLPRTDRTTDSSQLGRLVSDLNTLRNWVSLGFAQMLSGGAALITLLVILAIIAPTTFWIAGVCVAGVALTAVGITPRLRGQIRRVRRIRGRLTQQIVKAVLDPDTSSGPRGIPRLQRQLTPAAVRQSILTTCLRRSAELMHGLVLLLVAVVFASGKSDPHPTSHPVTTLLFLGLVATALREIVHAWSHRLAFIESRRRIVRRLRSVRATDSETTPPNEDPIPTIEPPAPARA
jgi:ABC-type multidrug transport system fused ATPase/permease subunit